MAVENNEGDFAGSADPVRAGRDGIELPSALMAKWQTIVDTMAELVDVPAGLIMRPLL